MKEVQSRIYLTNRHLVVKIGYADLGLFCSVVLLGYCVYRLNFQKIDGSKKEDTKHDVCEEREGAKEKPKIVCNRNEVDKSCLNPVNKEFVSWVDAEKRNLTVEEQCASHREFMKLKEKERQVEVAKGKQFDSYIAGRKNAKRDIGFIRGHGIGLAGYMADCGERCGVPIMHFGTRKVHPNPLGIQVYFDGPLSFDYFVIDATRRKHAQVDELLVLPTRTLEDCKEFDDPLDIICLSAREEPWTFKSDVDVLDKFKKLEKVAEQAHYYWFKDRSGNDSE